MDLASAKAIGAGIAVIALSGVGVGIGYIFAALVSSVARNPAARERVFGLAILGFALTEAVALALLVFFTVIIYGFWKNGLGFLKLFVPSGIPIYILPLVTFIEVMSFLSRPVSHSVRLFANMLAGHITLKVFGGFVVMLSAFGVLGWLGALLPLGLTIALTALELLVAALQAYVFAILTCIYLNDAIHPGH